MTSPVSAVEAIEKAMEGVTPGPWREGVEGNLRIYGPDGMGEHSGLIANIFKGRGNAAYIAACSPDRMREVLALARQAEALKRRAEAAEALVERMRQVAQAKTMEARTANSTIREIYQIVSSGKGEPGNWHGAEPVRAKLEALQRENAELRRLVENGQSFANQVRIITCHLNGQAYSSTVSDLNQFDTDLRRARTLLKEEANAE